MGQRYCLLFWHWVPSVNVLLIRRQILSIFENKKKTAKTKDVEWGQKLLSSNWSVSIMLWNFNKLVLVCCKSTLVWNPGSNSLSITNWLTRKYYWPPFCITQGRYQCWFISQVGSQTFVNKLHNWCTDVTWAVSLVFWPWVYPSERCFHC